jgi:hypothetical protein
VGAWWVRGGEMSSLRGQICGTRRLWRRLVRARADISLPKRPGIELISGSQPEGHGFKSRPRYERTPCPARGSPFGTHATKPRLVPKLVPSARVEPARHPSRGELRESA